MVTFWNARIAAIAALSIAAAVAVPHLETTRGMATPPPPQMAGQSSGFEGAWCAQGDRTKQCSISNNGAFMNFTNESGSTSMGHAYGNVATADEWNFVKGTLSSDGRRIDWSNGTYWTRCSSGGGGGGGGGHRWPNLDGTWYSAGNRSQACNIRQRKDNLQLRNESGQSANGSIDRGGHLTTNWSGTQIDGTISRDGNTIYWNNGTSWSR